MQSEWQPIEKAPFGKPILVTDGNVIVTIEIDEDDGWPIPVGFGGYEWEWDFSFSELTHWMELPNFPKK